MFRAAGRGSGKAGKAGKAAEAEVLARSEIRGTCSPWLHSPMAPLPMPAIAS